MAVRLYIGGTAGNKDGEPISNGDMSNPITFDGYDIETGDVSYAQFAKLYLRADEGEEWVGVCLKIADISSSEDLHDILIIGNYSYIKDGIGQTNNVICSLDPGIMLDQSNTLSGHGDTVTNTNGVYTLLFPSVDDTNSENNAIYLSPLLYLGLKDPHTSIKFIIAAGAKNE